jgi:hypothetical protein
MTFGGRASISLMNDRVDFVCARADHQRSEPNDALTMHQDHWAYCSGGAGEPHDWRPTGGMSLDDAKRFVGPHPVPPVRLADQRSD